MADRLNPGYLHVRLVRLPTRASLGAAHNETPTPFRELTVLSLHNTPDGDAVGWGECSALNEATYTSEWARGAFDTLTGDHPFDPSRHPMAAAAIEMALLDADLRAAGESLADRLGTAGSTSTAGAVVGLGPIPTMLSEITELVAAGYRRVKCKVAPGRVVEPIRAVVSEFPDLEVQIDANGSLGADDLGLLLVLRDLGVSGVEQPFAVGDHATAARLVAESDLTVIADESVTTINELWQVAHDQAATAVAIKPPRVGGLQKALDMLDAASQAGLGASVGGMVESGFGRHQLAAIAALDAFTITGDVSPAARWLSEDPFDDIEMVDGLIVAPSAHGVGPVPDLEVLNRVTIDEKTVAMPSLTDGD